MKKEEQIYKLLLSHDEPMTAREITNILYGPEKHQSIVFGKLEEMVRQNKLNKVGIQQPFEYTLKTPQIIKENVKTDIPTKSVQNIAISPSMVMRMISGCKIENLIHNFFSYAQENSIEIYNEFSLQHELGIYLRKHLHDYKVQFERNVSYFFQHVKTIKKEIDIVIYNDELKERYAIELKYPLNGQYPEQMYAFVKDIKFMEELKIYGFTSTFAVVLVNDRPFYSGKNNSGIYSFFRDEKQVYGTIQKPTGTINASDFITLEGNYRINWMDMGREKYYIVSIK